MDEKRYLVMYDITKDKIRTKILETCRYYGLKRIQYSVYGGIIPKRRIKELIKDIRKLSINQTDSIRVIPICQKCNDLTTIIGDKKEWHKKIGLKII